MAYFTPESPRFHSLHGDNIAAYDVLRKFASATTCRGADALQRLAAACPSADSLLRLTKRAPSIKEAAMVFFSRSQLLLNFTLVIVWISMNFGWLLSLTLLPPPYPLPSPLLASPHLPYPPFPSLPLPPSTCCAGTASAFGCHPTFKRMPPIFSRRLLLLCNVTPSVRRYGVKDVYEKGY